MTSNSQYTVYPRVCGGTKASNAAVMSISGLSPRVRGNLGQQRRAATCIRSIPACAGEPQKAERISSELRVYPRVCGGTGLSGRPAFCV